MSGKCENAWWQIIVKKDCGREEESVHTAGMGVGAIFACLKTKVTAKERETDNKDE